MTSLVETAAWLVDIPSVTGDETAIVEAVAGRLEGMDEHRIGRSLVVGRPTGGPMILLVGHLDTVPYQGQGPATIVDGKLHGLGAADMKGGLAVIIHLLEDRDVVAGPYSVVGIFYDGEEGPADGNGLGPLLDGTGWLTDAEFAVVLEPSDGQIQVGCNGSINAAVTFSGRSSHSARPWWGENAVTKAGEWLAEMHLREPEPHFIDGLEYREVMSVTMAAGGIARNVIPDRFELNLNYRFSPDRSVDDAIAVVHQAATGADSVDIVDVAPAGPVSVSHPFVGRLAAAAGAELAAKQGWTDVARLGEYGIPAVNFGPGQASEAHQRDEYVAMSQIEETFTALRRALTEDPVQ
ncbi:MAG TPA: succinyl-diaminopimelate desuccinylase [Acidimicrobiia bacterium]|nr:succinyl-diaminopimelate desuccinylase [Acidimicrobiia bacterium]